jgi:RHS repeat-associated protein
MKHYLYLFTLLICGITTAQNFQDTKGELQISNSGSATYKVPIALPPGIKDVAPQLALTYNGSSVQGMAGMGWNLVGISSISRVSSRIDLDGILDPVDFDLLDRYALDGQRLIKKTGVYYGEEGATYQTENYSNLKIESTGSFSIIQIPSYSPESFTVTFVDGSKAYYGGTADSRGLMNWMINRWIDPQGNYIDYTYETENNTQRIKKISWGNNINVSSGYENKIEFNYKLRLRTEYSYLNYNNIKIEVNKILNDVIVTTGGELFRKYILFHETVSGNYQRVKSIIETNGSVEVANPITFDYDNTAEGFATITKYNGVTEADLVNVKLSGDFDGNGEQDFVTDSKLYLNPIDNGSNWTGIPFSLGTKYFTATTLTNNKLNQFQSVVKVNESMSQIDLEVFNYSANSMNSNYKKTILFDSRLGVGPGMPECSGCYNPFQNPSVKESNRFFEGDFNGDGISEVIIESTINETWDVFGTGDSQQTCGCYYESKNEGKNFHLIDLNVNSSSEIGSRGYIKLNNSSFFNGDVKQVIDFNGDGKSDILIINPDKTYKVIGFHQLTFAPWTEIYELTQGTFAYYNKDNQIVFGDFNGDSKTDIMMPVAKDSSDWNLSQSTGSSFTDMYYSNFELYQPYWQGAPSTNRTRNKSYRAADLDRDGKSDFIIQEYETLCTEPGISGCGRDGRGYFRVRKNMGSLNSKPEFATEVVASVDSDYGYDTPIDVLIGNFRNHSAYNNFVFIQGKQVWKGNFNKDLSKEATLIKVTEAGGAIVQNISYKKLVPSAGLGNANDIYYSSNSETYPYAELARVPTMYVVDKLTATGANQTKIQEFKYFGLVTHSQGLGVLGFKKVARSSWYNTQNTDKIWSISVTSPQLNGAVIREFTSKFPTISNPNMEGIDKSNPTDLTLNTTVTTAQTAIASNSITLKQGFSANGINGAFRSVLTRSQPQTDNATTNDYLTRKDFYYTKVDKASKVSALRITKTSTKDVIAGTYSDTSFEYDEFENITKNTAKNGIATKTVQNTYVNNPTATDKNYCIGKLIQKNESVSAYGDTFTSEEKYNYNPAIPNLVKQTQKKGHNTDYINTDYVYDGFGNVTQKTVAATGVTSRKITDVYDTNGRFVIKKTDNEGYETTFEYNKLGQQTKSKDYLNVETNTSYDNWGKLLTNTVTGASSTVQTQSFAYLRYTGGYSVTTTGSTPDDFSRVFKDNFGREVKTTKRGFASGTFISKAVEYDFLGRKVKESEPYFDSSPTLATTSFPKSNTIIYDYLSRPITQLLYTGKQISITYDKLSSTTADGTKTVTTTADANGNKIEQTDNGEKLKYTYYANGNLKETVYGNHTITMQYDGWGRQTYMRDPSVSSTAYTKTYNNFGELLTDVTPTGTTTIAYSPTGKLVKKTATGQNTNQESNYNYDSKGFVTSETGTINGKNFTYTYTYNPYYQILTNTETTPDNLTHKKTFSYDGYGRVLQENTNSYLANNSTVNSGNNTIEYGYNAYNGMIDQYKDANTNTVLWKLNTANEKMQALTASLGNGMQITNKYDSYGYFQTANHATQTTIALNLEYQFNANRGTLNYRKNNIAGVLSWNENFVYDTNDRLTTWTDPTGTTNTSYETDGRIKNNDQVGTYNYETGNRYRKKSATLNATGLAFYNNRSLQTVSYDMFKNPITITEKNRGKVNFEYNLDSSRSKSVVMTDAGAVAKTKYYSGITAVEVIEKPNQSLQFITYIAGSPYDAAVVLEKTYTNSGGNYTPSTQEYLYLHRDYQGSILAISGNGGAIKERRQFDPWGLLKKCYKNNVEVPPSAFNNVNFELLTERGYTGHEHFFSVGIIHMNARLYDPILHTFLSADALISDPSNPQNYNRYAYALNNPLMYVDYDGNEPITAAVLITAAIIGAGVSATVYIGLSLYNGTAITWGGLSKSILVGAISGMASAGIGNIAQSATTAIFGTTKGLLNGVLLAVTKGVMHGAAQGIIQGVSGGNAGQSFITALATSIAGDAFGAIPGAVGRYAHSIVGQSLFGAVTGGVVSNMQGGNFWEGAVIGLTVGLLNHAGKKLYPAIDRWLQKKDSEVDVLLDTEGASGHGHMAMLAGNDDKGWRFVSKEGRAVDNSGDGQDGNILTGGKSAILDRTYATKAQALSNHPLYDRVLSFKTTYSNAMRAINATYRSALSSYHVLTANCGHAVADGLSAIDYYAGSVIEPKVRYEQILRYNNIQHRPFAPTGTPMFPRN